MKELFEIIEKVYETGNLPRGYTLADFRVLENVYMDLTQYCCAGFISEKCYKTLVKYGIEVKENGIGWEATR